MAQKISWLRRMALSVVVVICFGVCPLMLISCAAPAAPEEELPPASDDLPKPSAPMLMGEASDLPYDPDSQYLEDGRVVPIEKTVREPADPTSVKVLIINNSSREGAAAELREVLAEQGYSDITLGNGMTGLLPRTTMTFRYRDHTGNARELGAFLDASMVILSPHDDSWDEDRDLLIYLGVDTPYGQEPETP